MSISELSLNQIKEQVVELILESQLVSGEISADDVKRLREEYKTRFQANFLATHPRPQSGVTSATDFNETAFELQADLLATFRYLNDLERIINTHSELNISAVNTMTAMIESAEETLSAYEQMLAEQQRIDCHIIHFNDGSSTSSDYHLYTERFGEEVEATNYCQVDVTSKDLSLPYVRKQNMITYDDQVSAGHIQLSKQLCGLFSYGTNEGKKLERIIDTSYQTYWSDALFTDEPIRITFDGVRPQDAADLKDYYYGIQNGALFELEFVFESISRINELSLVPYAQFPFELVAVRYKTTDDIDEPLKEVICPDHEDEMRRGCTLERAVTLQFEEINCKRLYVICNQIHYTKENLLVDGLDLFKNTLWLGLNGDGQSHTLSEDVTYRPMYYDRFKEDIDYNVLTQLNEKVDQLDLKKILLKSDSYLSSLSKCRYQYGFYNISPNFVEFEEAGVFVTNDFSSTGNIRSIMLEAEETLPGSNGTVLTDIEYYISTGDSLNAKDWLPILPVNRQEIKSERLQLDGDYCTLRFPATYLLSIQSSGQLLTEGQDFQVVRDSNQQIIGVRINGYLSTSIYAAHYVPSSEAKELTLIEGYKPKLSNITESISATGVTYYDLSEHPYQETDTEFPTEIKLFDKETGRVLSQNSGDVICVTEYMNPEESYLNFDPNSSKIQYYTYKNQIFFSQPIPSNYDIEINYQHSVSSFCVKAILRRNSREHKWLTPRLSKLKLKVDTVN